MATSALRTRPAWASLKKHYQKMRRVHLRQLFDKDRERGERMAVEAAGIYFDYSKNRITDETLGLLLQLAEESGLRDRIDAMFHGDKINVSEKRAVLHVALRAPRGASILHDGHNVVPEVHAVLDKMAAFADHGEAGDMLAPDGGDCEAVLAGFAKAGIDVDALAKRLQDEGAASFVKSWNDLMACIESKRVAMRKAS